jgi:hypothetical protein
MNTDMKGIIRALAGIFIGTMFACTGLISLAIGSESSTWSPFVIVVGLILLGISYYKLANPPEV